ncbi:MAG: hypothetical protein A2V99_10595 [Spirochaetes bacterium RBG_16_67_19]|nr:MAG: hypothetical protein A2V99_10595 [Spirochaetes bacterium RBG_16_67_19]
MRLRKILAESGVAVDVYDQEQWQGNWVLHPQRGKLDLARWLEMYVEHSETHLGYIERNLGLWRQRRG